MVCVVQAWVWISAVSVPAPQRAEQHAAALHSAAVFDFEMHSIVVDLQRSPVVERFPTRAAAHARLPHGR